MLSWQPQAAYPGLPVLNDQLRCRLEAEIPMPLQVDGEYLGDLTSVELRSLPGALTVVAPPAPPALDHAGARGAGSADDAPGLQGR
jgi:hypothetical protein